MTVALGIVCSDGVVVASDSMGANGMRASTGQKVHALPGLPAVWTASGTQYLIEEVEQELLALEQVALKEPVVGTRYKTPDLPGIRQNISTIRTKMRDCYGQFMQVHGGQSSHPFASDFLILGWANGTPWFLEVSADGQMNWHTDIKFYAIGSGGDFATVCQALMAHYFEGDTMDVHVGLRIAYRAIETTCKVSSMLVGPPVQLAKVDKNGASILTKEECDEIGMAVERWKQLEREMADTLRSGGDELVDLVEPVPSMDDVTNET